MATKRHPEIPSSKSQKRKRNEENTDKKSKKQKLDVDLTIFAELPPELFINFIVRCIPRDFLYVSKEFCMIASKVLHLDPRVKFDLQSFLAAITSESWKGFKMHLKYGELNQQDIKSGFEAAAENKIYSVSKYLIQNDYLKDVICSPMQTYIENKAISAARTDLKLFKYLLKKIERPNVPTGLLFPRWHLDTEIVKAILKYGVLSLEPDYSTIFKKLAEEGEVELVLKLLDDPKFNIKAETIYITFREVIYYDRKEIMKLLAPRLTVHPTDSSFLESAINLDRPKTLKLLLKLGVCDPMANGAKALFTVLTNTGQKHSLKMIKILLADPRMDLSLVPNAPIWAYKAQHTEEFELLLQQPKINPLCRDPDSDPMTLNAAGFFTIRVIQGGLFDYKPTPTPEDQKDPTIIDMMLKSFWKVKIPLLFSVLTHPRVNFDYYAGYTIARAMQSKQYYVAEAVLNDSRVRVIDRQHRKIAMTCAKENSLKDIKAKIRALKKANLDFKCTSHE